jgi:hypothetical protein
MAEALRSALVQNAHTLRKACGRSDRSMAVDSEVKVDVT